MSNFTTQVFKGSLNVHVLLSPKGVRQITLTVAPQAGFHAQVIGEGSSQLYREVEQWLEAYAGGRPPAFIPKVDLGAFQPFTQRVLVALQEIPFGQTTTYSGLADRLGSPRASRAVGTACGRNPAPLLIPCHRVLAVGGRLGGFSCGLPIKEMLLAHEFIVDLC